MESILTFNAGSSSIKYSAFHLIDGQLILRFKGLVEGIGESTGRWIHESTTQQQSFSDHLSAFKMIIQPILQDIKGDVIAVAHRVVHGGTQFYKPTLITDQVIKEVKALKPLAPLHNPANALGIEIAKSILPDTPHFAIFDTAFHITMPPKAKQYAIDRNICKSHHIQRYGFHGINHQYVAEKAARFLLKPISDCQLITLHLGNGASGCLIKSGQSQDTSMGFTPLPGLIMGTRCGDIDPAIISYLYDQGISMEKITHLLYEQSGLKGVGGDNDMRRLQEKANAGNEQAKLAIELFCYQIQKYIGAYISQCPKLDALVFTGGIGEHASEIRNTIIQPLAHLGLAINIQKNNNASSQDVCTINDGAIPILVIKGDEEKAMAEQALAVI